MKRIIVMNGSKLTQVFTNNTWQTRVVESAGSLANGIYPA
ncbi:hypothetical protein HA052_04035 [Chromobacterium haemolyticum]|uniref:Uncharacterized protein n=1 Tax=Chromobacterium fluminis TaxID=3044269 RepID=A0ABX0KXY6_9NEIS|nr:KfrB domain-containing protein [Chromobacterium haemolyticum]NHR04360.1 hypothetical protein [Chromobacterium haemolyticum]